MATSRTCVGLCKPPSVLTYHGYWDEVSASCITVLTITDVYFHHKSGLNPRVLSLTPCLLLMNTR